MLIDIDKISRKNLDEMTIKINEEMDKMIVEKIELEDSEGYLF